MEFFSANFEHYVDTSKRDRAGLSQKLVLVMMKTVIKRHSKGSPGGIGGRFAKGQRAAETASSKLDLSQQAVPNHITDVSELVAYVDGKEHLSMAVSQAYVADTAAEMWYSQLEHDAAADTRRHITEFLREGHTLLPLSPVAIELAKSLQYSILTAPLEKPCVVYRGIKDEGHNDYASHLAKTVQPGEMIEGNGFWSTTTDPKTAQKFCGDYDNPVIFQIETEAGKFLPASSSVSGSDDFYPESEVVLPHGAKYEVINKQTLANGSDPDGPQEYTLISLKYVGVSEYASAMTSLDYHNDGMDGLDEDEKQYLKEEADEADEMLAISVMWWVNTYEEAGLPLGNYTTYL